MPRTVKQNNPSRRHYGLDRMTPDQVYKGWPLGLPWALNMGQWRCT